MKIITTIVVLVSICIFVSCSKIISGTNGELIYRKGKNLDGVALLDKHNSQFTIFKSCQGCHGSSGTRIKNCNIQWANLSSTSKMQVPYTDELFYRFIDEDLKSDGTKAQTGVHWKMSRQEKDDLIEYLKTLE